MTTARTIETRIHGRYLVEAPAHPRTLAPSHPVLVGFHGYRENAQVQLDVMRRMVGDAPWMLVSIQALNRFYSKGTAIAAGWMTTEDRDLAIADNVAYVSAVLAEVEREHGVARPLVYAGFSQGVAMAYRAAAFAGRPCDGLVLLAGDVPPDVAPVAASLPPILLGRGTADTWYTAEKAARDLQALGAAGARVTEVVFDGGHEWAPSFVARAGAFLGETLGQRQHREG